MDRHSFYVNVGSILRVRRKAEGLTLDALAKKINKSTATLSKYEKKAKLPLPWTFWRICAVC